MESNRMHTILVLLFLFSARFIGADDFGTNGVIVSAKTNQTACEAIHPERLPEECICRDPDKYGLIIECMKPFNSPFFNDTIGMKISIDPCCPEGSNISIEIIEKQHDIDFEVAGIKSGDELNIPIPGLSLIIPSIGHFGIDTTVAVYGNLDKLSILIGLNACMVVGNHQVCASTIPGLDDFFPWYVLEGTYSFGDYCNDTSTLSLAEI